MNATPQEVRAVIQAWRFWLGDEHVEEAKEATQGYTSRELHAELKDLEKAFKKAMGEEARQIWKRVAWLRTGLALRNP